MEYLGKCPKYDAKLTEEDIWFTYFNKKNINHFIYSCLKCKYIIGISVYSKV